MWKKEKLLVKGNFPFPTLFSTGLENFLSFSSNVILSLQSLSVWKSLKFVSWERINNCQAKNFSILTFRGFFFFLLVCLISTLRVPRRSKSGWQKQDSVENYCVITHMTPTTSTVNKCFACRLITV